MGAFKRLSAATTGASRLRLPELGLADCTSPAGVPRPVADDGLTDALLGGLLSKLCSSLLTGRDGPAFCPATEDRHIERKARLAI
jgi:hypothetical protein